MAVDNKQYSLIIPVYNNAGSISELVNVLVDINTALSDKLEVVFVVDGSPDDSYQLLRDVLPSAVFASKLIALSRNFGSFAAVAQGLELASGPYFAIMAADLQEPPELIVDFFKTLEKGECDIVIGKRLKRDDPRVSRAISRIYWELYRRIVQPDIPSGGVDVFACNRQVRDTLSRLKESNSSLLGLLFWIGFRREFIEYGRLPRHSGESGWSFAKKFKYMADSAYAFSALPITILVLIGSVGIAASLLYTAILFGLWLLGDVPVVGFTPIMLAISFSTSLILLSLGIVGGYVWRAYANTQARPYPLVMTSEEFEGKDT
ncbi:glycosyltransferase family 2 protein [Gammaproteobacteria bacterium]|nr:glycosyltransferase family 2 protein [Gammaproteobacteria bacterium]